MKLHELIDGILQEKDYSKAILTVRQATEAYPAFREILSLSLNPGESDMSDVIAKVASRFELPYRTATGDETVITWQEAWNDIHREYRNGSIRVKHGRFGYLFSTLDVMNRRDANLLINAVFMGEPPLDKSLLVLAFPGVNDPKGQGGSDRRSEAPGS